MKKITLIAPLLVLFLFSCKDKTSTTLTTPNNNNNNGSTSSATFASKFAALANGSKQVTMNTTSGISFYGNSGTRYQFPAQCFVDAAGQVVSGNVNISVVEYVRKSDMIFSGVLPISNGEPLVSGGEIYVNATQNGRQLYMRPGYNYIANIPQNGASSSGMSLFFGAVTDDSLSKVNWKAVKADSNSIAGIVYMGDTITIFSDSMGYCNADMFMKNPNYQSFNINVNGVTFNDDTYVCAYAVYDNYKGVWKMSANKNVIAEQHVPNIPVHFVIMVISGNDFYGGIMGATPQTGKTYDVTVTKTDPVAFKALVDPL